MRILIASRETGVDFATQPQMSDDSLLIAEQERWRMAQQEKQKIRDLEAEQARLQQQAAVLDRYARVESASSAPEDQPGNLLSAYPDASPAEIDASLESKDALQTHTANADKPQAELTPAERESQETQRIQREFASVLGAVPYGGYGN